VVAQSFRFLIEFTDALFKAHEESLHPSVLFRQHL